MNWVVETLFASALLIAVVLILRRPAARLFGPHAAYLLWTLPALRLLLPPIPGANFAALPPIDASQLAISGLPGIDASPTAPQAAALAPSPDLGSGLLILWLSVAAVHMVWHVVSYRRFLRGVAGSQTPVHTLGDILVCNADVAGPAAGGILRRRIFLPYDFADRFDRRERRLALAHEVAHHRRGDLVANWLALAVLSLHWFNPLAHIAYRAFRADQELSCDATVLSAASAKDRHAYASAVVKAAWVKSPVAACPMNSAGQLKIRLAMMNTRPASAPRHLAGLAVVFVMAGAALGITASRTAAALPPAIAQALQNQPGLSQALPRLGDGPSAGAADDNAGVAVPAADSGTASDLSTPAQHGFLETPPVDAASHDLGLAPAAPAQKATAEEQLQPVVAGDDPVSDIAAVQTATLSMESAAVQPAVALRPTGASALPSARVLRSSAIQARKELRSFPSGTAFRNVRAVMVDGRFNAVNPGVPYVGFCGQLLVAKGGDWLPFFVSTTPSRTRDRAAKCAGPMSAESYTSDFYRASRSFAQGRNACTADQPSCIPAYYARAAQAAGDPRFAMDVADIAR